MTPELPSGYHLIALDDVDSTNEETRRRSLAGTPPGAVIWARSQSAGRGRHGREWQSPRGNLYCSLLLAPAAPVVAWPQLGYAAALAVGETVTGCLPAERAVSYKWPNDVLVDGRKIGGILSETLAAAGRFPRRLIVGMGLNLSLYPSGTVYGATSLRAEGAELKPEPALEELVKHFDHWCRTWGQQGFEPLREAWLLRAEGLGHGIEVRLGDRTLTGRFEGLDSGGLLLIATLDGGRKALAAGEVTYARSATAAKWLQ